MAFHFDLALLRDSTKTFPPSPIDLGIQSLRIWHCGYTSLSRIADFAQLRVLEIASYPDDTLQPVAALTELRYLRIVHLPKVSSLAPLGALHKLRILALETAPSWDAANRVLEVESLDPVRSLPALQHLSLVGVLPPDRSLEPLQSSRQLRSVRVSKYPRKEIARFFRETGWSDAHVPEPDAA